MIRIATWNDWLNDPAMYPWVEKNIDVGRFMLHVDNPTPNAKVEFFTCDSTFMIREALDICKEVGVKPWFCIDWHYGNGRNHSYSPVGPGRYHRDLCEGGVTDAVNSLLHWMPEDTFGVQLGNEQKAPSTWYTKHVKTLRKKLNGRAKVIVGGSDSNVSDSHNYADAIDLHLLRSNWMDQWLRFQHGKPFLISELCPPLDCWDLKEYEYTMLPVLKEFAEGIGVFTGNTTLNYPDQTRIRWNFKDHKVFTAFTSHGKTPVGMIWENALTEETMAITTIEVQNRLNSLDKELKRVEDRIMSGEGNTPRLRGRRDELKDQINWLERFLN